jgi:DNA topoisomerase IA
LADANKKLGLATDQVKDILDVLYRKLTLITYPRTDACRIDVPMCEKFRKSLLRIYPRDDINLTEANELFFNKKKSKGQDGHAAITPVDLENTPEKVKNKMESGKSFSTEEMHKLYTLIYNRTKLAFFNPAINENTKTILINKDNEFVNSISKPKYLG